MWQSRHVSTSLNENNSAYGVSDKEMAIFGIKTCEYDAEKSKVIVKHQHETVKVIA